MAKKEKVQKVQPQYKILKVRVEGNDGQYRTLHEANEPLGCNRCSRKIGAGEQFTRREHIASIMVTSRPSIEYDPARYPVCRICEPWKDVSTLNVKGKSNGV